MSKPPKKPSVLKGVIAALFGVQSDEQRKADFEQGDPSQFIGLGIVVVIVLVIAMASFVSWVTHG